MAPKRLIARGTRAILAALSFSFALPAYGQSLEWFTRFNGSATGTNQLDIANAIAVDSAGCTIVTGQSSTDTSSADAVTIKYSPTGAQLWLATYNGPANSADVANAVAVDAFDNIFIVGTSNGVGTGSDYFTAKYDSNGVELWSRRYANPGSTQEQGRALVVDASGNVYVTGQSGLSDQDADIATIKYDTDGNVVWLQRFSGPGNDFDRGNAIALSPSGRVFVTGVSETVAGFTDYGTVAYENDGTFVWFAGFSGAGVNVDRAFAIAATSDGGVVITGESATLQATNFDYATIRYDADGNVVWTRIYNGPGNNVDRGLAIAFDKTGNTIVTGTSRNAAGVADFATIKYDALGNEIWTARYDGPGAGVDEARAVVVDADDNIYICGDSRGVSSDADFAVIKYNPAGVEQWVYRLNGPDNRADFPRAIAIDVCNNVFVTGYVTSLVSTNTEYATIKLSQPGAPPQCPVDLDADGEVGLTDLTALLSQFGNSGGGLQGFGDIDCDGDVDLEDLAALLAAFGTVCA